MRAPAIPPEGAAIRRPGEAATLITTAAGHGRGCPPPRIGSRRPPTRGSGPDFSRALEDFSDEQGLGLVELTAPDPHRQVVVDEAGFSRVLSAKIAARLQERRSSTPSDAPVLRICSAEAPVSLCAPSRAGGASGARADRGGGARIAAGPAFELTMPTARFPWRLEGFTPAMVGLGDVVKRGDIVALVDTEKAEIEVEIWNAGRVDRILLQSRVGRSWLERRSSRSRKRASHPASVPPLIRRRHRAPSAGPGIATIPHPRSTRFPSDPGRHEPPPRTRDAVGATRRSRARHGPEPRVRHGPRGPGAGGRRARERRDDPLRIARCSSRRHTAQRTDRGRTLRPVRRQTPLCRAIGGDPTGVAAAMARSKRKIPHYYLELDVDMTSALAWLEAANRKRSVEERLILRSCSSSRPRSLSPTRPI